MAIPFLDLSFLQNSNTPVNNAYFQPPQGDPYAALDAILNNLNNQPLAQAPQQSTLDRILMGIAQAAAVGASRDPGETLTGLIKSKQAERTANVEALRQRQNLINQVQIQKGFQQAESLAREQSEFRKERRQNIADIQKEQRGVKLFKQQKDIELAANKSLMEQNEAFEVANEQARLSRARNKAIVDLLPEKFKQAAIWEANARSLVPDIDPTLIQSIIDKKSGINLEPINSKEQELIVKVNREAFKQDKERYELAKRKTEADITESGQRGKAALIGANAAMLSARNQSYNNTMQNWATKQKLDVMETQFYKSPSGAIVSLDEVNKLPITEKFQAVQLSAEENAKEQQKRIAQINQAVGQTQQINQAEQQKLEQGDPLINLINQALQTQSKEQVKNLILNSNRPQADKDRAMEILGFAKPAKTPTVKTKTIGGSSVPLPSIDFNVQPIFPGASGITDIPSNILMLLQNMFKKNTPEENKRILEEQRQRGSFGQR